MAHIVDDEIYCCTDCLMIIANDDASGMDEETEARCRTGIDAMHKRGYWLICNNQDPGNESEFSWSACEICGSRLGGNRHRLALLTV